MQTLDPELREALEGEAGNVLADLLRRNVLMPVAELERALDLQIAEGNLVPRDRLRFAGRDEKGRLYRVIGP